MSTRIMSAGYGTVHFGHLRRLSKPYMNLIIFVCQLASCPLDLDQTIWGIPNACPNRTWSIHSAQFYVWQKDVRPSKQETRFRLLSNLNSVNDLGLRFPMCERSHTWNIPFGTFSNDPKIPHRIRVWIDRRRVGAHSRTAKHRLDHSQF